MLLVRLLAYGHTPLALGIQIGWQQLQRQQQQ
jgi:hypothetical protein